MCSNKDFYNELIEDMPSGMRENFPSYDTLIQNRLSGINMNDFIQTLCNKIGKMMYFEQRFYNPYEVLFAGSLPYGYSVEELFMESPLVIDLLENFEGANDEFESLYNTSSPKFHGLISNIQLIKKSKISISEKRVKSAFYNEGGLQRLLQTIISELRTTLAKEKYREFGVTLEHLALGVDYNNEQLQMKQPVSVLKVTNLVNDILKTIKDFTLTSDKFNMSKVSTQCTESDIVVYTTSENYSLIMNNYNAISSGRYDIRVVDNLPSEYNNGSGKTTIVTEAIVMDKRTIPALNNYDGTQVIENPNTLELDYFYYECFNLPVNTFSNFCLLVK